MMNYELIEIIKIQQRLLNSLVNHWNPEVQNDLRNLNNLFDKLDTQQKEDNVQPQKS
jgi:hypothetical protein